MNTITVELIPAPRRTFSIREWKKIRQCMNEGFFVTEREDGNVTLEKKPKIFITIECDNEEKRIDIHDRLVNFYGKDLHTEELYQIFKKDLDSGKVQVLKDENGFYVSTIE